MVKTEMEAEKTQFSSAKKEATNASVNFDSSLICATTNGGSAPPPPPVVIKPKEPATLPTAHAPKCACGCVPNILSLFEMAELRKQAKLKREAEKKINTSS